MKKLSYIVCLIISLFACSMTAFAEDAVCDYKKQAELLKKAVKITAKTEVVKENGEERIDISVYNITDEFYLVVRPESTYSSIKNSFMIYPSMTKDQSYTFKTDNIDTVVTYKFVVRSRVPGCTGDIHIFYLVKPRKNTHYNMSYCKYKEVIDYYYCQEWVEQDFGLTDEQIKEKIEKKRDSLTTTTTAYCPSCKLEEEQQDREKKIYEIKKYIIIGLSTGIVIDLIVIAILLHDLKRRGL